MERDEQRHHLLAGLLGDGPYRQDYLTSALFHASIDTLMEMLPMWIEGFAAHASRNDVEYREAVRLAMKPGPLFVGKTQRARTDPALDEIVADARSTRREG